ncbi:MAG: small multi-drug export protein [Planctomycetaceae bacterium]|nr:small multi-drug export protein [Planctomycetaceae bacterium]
MDELHSAERRFRRRAPAVWYATLFGPFLLSVIILALLLYATGWSFTRRLVIDVLLSLYVLGRFVILLGSDGTLTETSGSLSSEQLFLLVTYMDVMTALVLAFHIGFLFRVPLIGDRFRALVTDGHFILDSQPWMRRATFLGLVLFVSFPLTATGAVGGSIFGRLLGMSRQMTLLGIILGSLLGNGIMYFFSESMGQFKDHPVIKYGGFVLIALIAVILERRYRVLRKRFSDQEPK